jgi:hypothetical protein
MRQLTAGFMTLLALLVCTSTGLAQQTEVQQAEYEQKVQRVVQDSTLLTMVIEQVAEDPQLRSEVIQQVTQTMQEEGTTTAQQPNIEAMLQDTAVQAHMQEHMRLMQSLNQGQQVDPNQQQMDPNMAQSPEMQRQMIQMHLQCMQMMQQDTTQMQQGSHMQHDNR